MIRKQKNCIQEINSMEQSKRKSNNSNLNSNAKNSSNISVYIRIRPFNHLQDQNETCIEHTDQQNIGITLKEFKQAKDKDSLVNHNMNHSNNFLFDRIFTEQSEQDQIYRTVGKNAIDTAFNGINATIFCYGQTSSGKTYTCVGNLKEKQQFGILPRLVLETLERIDQLPKNIEAKIKISMVEIYNEKIRDLIDVSKQDLKIRSNKKDGIFLENVTQRYILSEGEAFEYLTKGIDNRAVNATNMNACSSRSHMLFMITLNTHDLYTGQACTAKICLVDLAGSEKISKTGAEGKVLEEAKKINASLTALGKVINALSDHKTTHVPYRESKLTRLLQESLGGNCLTNLIVNVSPSSYNQSETLTSLRFGARAKSIKNQPKVNKSYTVSELLALLTKAEKTIKQQSQIIQNYQEKGSQRQRRNGGYGTLPPVTRMITMHMIPDDDDDEDKTWGNTSEHENSEPSSMNQIQQISESSQTFNHDEYNSCQQVDEEYSKRNCQERNRTTSYNLQSSLNKLEQITAMKSSLPNFKSLKEGIFQKSKTRKAKKIVTLAPNQLLPLNQNLIQEIENIDPVKPRHKRKRSSSVELLAAKKCKEEAKETNNSITEKQNTIKNQTIRRRTVNDNQSLQNLAKIKQNLIVLKLRYMQEKKKNAINELKIKRKNQIIEKYEHSPTS